MTQQLPSVESLQQRRRIARKMRNYAQRSSKLEPHRHKILSLRQNGATYGDIQFFLQTMVTPPVSVARSTIKRFLDRPPEAL